MKNITQNRTRSTRRNAGFSLLELMLAIALFLVVGGAVLLLFVQAMPTYNSQQNLAGLSISLQNAVSQLQQDVVNAGTGYYSGSNIPSWPVGVAIINQSDTTACASGSNYSYTAGCYDTLNIIMPDPNTPAEHLGTSGGTINTNTSSSFVLYTPGFTAAQLTALAADYKSGDELLLVSSSGLLMTTITLTSAGSVSGGAVTLNYNETSSTGTNTTTTDPLGITTHSTTVDNGSAVFGVTYGNSDWIFRLQPITYSVSLTTASNPTLQRTQSGTANNIAQEIIGFRIGAALWNDAHNTDTQTYNYQASSYGTGYDFTIVRSLRVSIIGRTTPGSYGVYSPNSFDGGPYQVLGAAVVINPRNLSMADN